MKIAVIGTGHIGGTLGQRWRAAGHEVVYGSRAAMGPPGGPVHLGTTGPTVGRVRNRPPGRTGLRDGRHRVRRRMAYRRYCARPFHAAIAADRRNRDRDPGHSVVGAPPNVLALETYGLVTHRCSGTARDP